jgi:hypothetical protein
LEKWRYRHIYGVGDDVEIEFVDPSGTGEYRMAMSPDRRLRSNNFNVKTDYRWQSNDGALIRIVVKFRSREVEFPPV